MLTVVIRAWTALRDFGSKTCAISLIYFMFCPVGIYRKYYYMMKCHVWILISLDTTATKYTNVWMLKISHLYFFLKEGRYQGYQFNMQCCCVPKFMFHWIPWLPMVPISNSKKWHVRILISLDTMATKATNLICNVVVYQNSCFIWYHGYKWYKYVFFPIKPFCLRFYRNRVSGEVEGEGGGDGVKVEGKIGRTELPAAVRFLRLRNPLLSLLLFIFYYQRVISAVNHQFLLKCISIIQIGQK